MTFPALEESVYSGRPLHLYQFSRETGGITMYWFYNTSDRDVFYLSDKYVATAISNDGVRLNGEAASSEMKVTLPITTAFCLDYRLGGTVPADTVYLRVYAGHEADISDNVLADARLYWIGTVDGLTQKSDVEAELTCSMLPATFQRTGLRYGYLPQCPHMLYEPLTCKVDRELYRIGGTCVAVSGNSVTVDEFSVYEDGFFDGGFIEYVIANGATERRLIRYHAGSIITTMGVPPGLEEGMRLDGFAGCARTIRACREKFGNFDNYGGFTNMPGRSPFDGKPVF
jgi:uncharacterized phage protein (TIGR02218 family)